MLANLTPQEAVNRGLPMPSACDLTVVVLWARMGTPLSGPRKPDGTAYLSGTEWEYLDAQAARKPILLYRKTARVQVDLDDPDFDQKRAQKKLVEEFFAQFKAPDGSLTGAYTPFETAEQFAKRLEQDLESEMTKLIETPAGAMDRATPRALTVTALYRDWLKARCARVELLGLRLRQGQSVRLGNVYVPLTTLHAQERAETRLAEETSVVGAGRGEREPRLLLLHRLGESSLYVPGDAGSGKSTFCRWVSWLVCEGPVPAADVDTPDELRELLPDSLRSRLPLLIPLREFWPVLPAAGTARAFGRTDVEHAIAQWVDRKAPDGLTGEDALAHLAQGSSLLILDGIDEVPLAPRGVLTRGLEDAVPRWTKQGNRLLVTSRPYGLPSNEVAKLSLPVAPLQPLVEPLQRMLVQRWFRILEDTPEKGDATAADLLGEVSRQAWLTELAENPLLLTAICIVYGQGRRLPQERHELYEEIVNTVLYSRIEDKSRQALVRDRLTVVAHGMHTGTGLGVTRTTPQAEVTDEEIERMLREYQERSSWSELQKREIRDDREELLTQTGLLLPRDDRRAGFYHLSFQEFLAAQRCTEIEGHRLAETFAERGRIPEWRHTLAFVFGRILAMHSSPEPAVRLLTEVVRGLASDQSAPAVVAADCMEVLAKRGINLPPEVPRLFREVALAMMRGAGPARDRCRLGDAILLVNDPRFRADAWFLPGDDLLGFVEVPAGPFRMGSDERRDRAALADEQAQHDVELPRFLIGRFPVTVAQFGAFVETTGFTVGDPGCLRGVANHPVVSVSWHEGLAYANWLTETLRAWKETPEPLARLLRQGDRVSPAPWRVTLPSEAEWEKAARGRDGRIYPWGDEADPDRANYGDTGIGGTSTVGCFPRGASPYGVEELSGNVWEWTRSLRQKYPYVVERKREDLGAGDDVRRVVRGGAFDFASRYVRAASRIRDNPDLRYDFFGFRVVVAPFFPGL
jgi:formylglycine-generating enzyme required for sulfatase activity